MAEFIRASNVNKQAKPQLTERRKNSRSLISLQLPAAELLRAFCYERSCTVYLTMEKPDESTCVGWSGYLFSRETLDIQQLACKHTHHKSTQTDT